MKLPKIFYRIVLQIVLLLVLILTIALFYNYSNSFDFYRNLKTIFLLLLITGILISNNLKIKEKNIKIIKIFSSPLSTFGLNFLTICFLALFINRIIVTGFKTGELIYNQISSIVLGLISLGVFIYLHLNNLKDKNNMA